MSSTSQNKQKKDFDILGVKRNIVPFSSNMRALFRNNKGLLIQKVCSTNKKIVYVGKSCTKYYILFSTHDY